ncbi:HlyD family efflux transporter periplasmic adaptor subunit [bacterium]|nr:HlyD family efflux transporter periplasmic adaptor subunit [bacterium]
MTRFSLRFAATLLLSLVLSGCALLPTGSTTLENPFASQANEPTPTPIPTAIVPLKPTYEVRTGEILRQTAFSGRVSPVEVYDLFFRSGGRVRQIYATRGATVQAGDVIADLEIDDVERQVVSAQLNLERAESRLAAAETELEFNRRAAQIAVEIAELRLAELREDSPDDATTISIQEKQVELAQIGLERLERGVDSLLQNDVARAQLELDKLNTAIEDAQIRAPIDGQILTLSLTVGRPVEAFAPVVVVANPDQLEISSDLTSTQMQDLSEGMPVTIKMVGRPGQTLNGEIRRLPSPFGTGGGVSVDDLDKSTRIAIQQSPEEIGYGLGDLMQVEVELERKADILWLPPAAIRIFDGRRFVVIQDGDVQRRVDVQTGIQTPDQVEILEGLELGQVVVGQ